jgi:hypothetical protein
LVVIDDRLSEVIDVVELRQRKTASV